jgi:hypothetical protein
MPRKPDKRLENLRPGRGRPKGSKNKVQADLKQKMLDILADLEKQHRGIGDVAKEDPKWFFENFIKPLLPKDSQVAIKVGVSEGTMAEVVRAMQAARNDGTTGDK